MSARPRVIAIGVADEVEVVGTSGVRATWAELETTPLGNGRSYRELFGPRDDTFRRLDLQSKAIVVAAAATGIDRLLDEREREDTALVTETTCGGIEVDFRYTSALTAGVVHGAIFPYSLQSTCLGDVALRHGLRGPTVCLSVEPDARGEALREVERMVAAGEVRHAVVASVDALGRRLPNLEPSLRAVMAVVEAPDVRSDRAARPSVADWPAEAVGRGIDPFDAWSRACRGLAVR